MPPPILFNSRTVQWAWLSNFWRSPIKDKLDRIWPSAEHMYQALKSTSQAEQEAIRLLPSSAAAKKAGRAIKHLSPDWEKQKVAYMESILRRKFQQNPDLAQRLIDTGDTPLIHLSPWDGFWGTGKRHEGKNVLGQILMRIRSDLQGPRPG